MMFRRMTRSAQLCIFALASPAAALPPAHGLWINRRTLLSHGAAASVLLPLRKAPAAAPAAAGAGVAVYEIASAALDRRSYRGLRLANGLQVLLASDPAAGKAAAAMNVAVGSMSNPEAWQGLAHFCEHMLFLGTASYPDEGDFESYIASNGGSNNAYTDSEETVYFFDVGAGALPGALARFSDFFAAPLFTESATAREVAAIESEHSKNIQSDGWRTEQLLRATRGVSGHPYNGSPHTCYHHGTEPTLDSRLWRYGTRLLHGQPRDAARRRRRRTRGAARLLRRVLPRRPDGSLAARPAGSPVGRCYLTRSTAETRRAHSTHTKSTCAALDIRGPQARHTC